MAVEQASLGRRCMAEFVGTFILIFIGCGVVLTSVMTGAQSGLWQAAIVWGVGVMGAVYTIGGISGGHINPAISVAMAAWGRFPWRDVVPYAVSQTAGAFVAAAILFTLFNPMLKERERIKGVERGKPGSEITAMCFGEFFPSPGPISNSPGPYSIEEHERANALVTEQIAFMCEVLATMVLAMVVMGVTDDRNPGGPPSKSGPLFIGLTVAALVSIMGPLTQACFNPARDFGPRLFTMLAGWGTAALPRGAGVFTVYILAPIVGAVIGVGVYDRILKPGDELRTAE